MKFRSIAIAFLARAFLGSAYADLPTTRADGVTVIHLDEYNGYFAAEDRLAHVGMISHLGSMIPVAAGCAKRMKERGGLAVNVIEC